MKRIIFLLIILLNFLYLSGREAVIFVSILPQRFFVEQIVGDDFAIEVMVQPGHNPASYEPTPKQMVELAEAEYYFTIGVPFEKVWLDRIRANNPQLKIVESQNNIELQPVMDRAAFEDMIVNIKDGEDEADSHFQENHMDELHKHKTHFHDHHGNDGMDPHIWLSPRLVKIQADNICRKLLENYPQKKEEYLSNLARFKEDLDMLADEIKQSFHLLDSRKFLVFHPAWGYFAKEFNLQQIPIEIEGKEPSPRTLGEIINYAKRNKIKQIFVQEQFNASVAKAIADAINGKVIKIDPLAEDYINNMRQITETISGALSEDNN